MFSQRDSSCACQSAIPAALTKDKKRIEGEELAVYLDWQSTLYVTNFPEEFDAVDLQRLFEPVSFGKFGCINSADQICSTVEFLKHVGQVSV